MAHKRLSKHSSEFDYPTIIMISILAYVVTTALHEFCGHAVACSLLSGTITELNAFYIDCQYEAISDLSIRLIAIAGPLASLLTGVITLLLVRRLRKLSPHMVYFLWLLGTISLMTATSYLIFSGITGVGDFGISRDGALFQMSPSWLWRIVLTVVGIIAYGCVVINSLKSLNSFLGGENPKRTIQAKTLTLISYLSGCIMAVLVGLLNPKGFEIILLSSLASTAGGTSALLWMMRFLKADEVNAQPLIKITRNYYWIGVGLIFLGLYAIVFGPSLYL